MKFHTLIITKYGRPITIKMWPIRKDVKTDLLGWVISKWDNAEMGASTEEFGIGDADGVIDAWFERNANYRYFFDTASTPDTHLAGEEQEPDEILLTPGMCRIVRIGLGKVNFGKAHEALFEAGEASAAEKNSGQTAIMSLTKQFEA
jgi:hypothetical protein